MRFPRELIQSLIKSPSFRLEDIGRSVIVHLSSACSSPGRWVLAQTRSRVHPSSSEPRGRNNDTHHTLPVQLIPSRPDISALHKLRQSAEQGNRKILYCLIGEPQLTSWRLHGVIPPWLRFEACDVVGISLGDGRCMTWRVYFNDHVDSALRGKYPGIRQTAIKWPDWDGRLARTSPA